MNVTSSYIFQPANFRLDGGAMFGIIPKPLWHKVAPADEQNRIDLALRLWVIADATPGKNRLVVVDTGIGDYHDQKFQQRFDIRSKNSPLVACLKTIGKTAEEVTDLVISHLHFDHVGGIGAVVDSAWQPVFPKARLHLHKSHYEYAQAPTERDAGSFHREHFEPVIAYYRERQQLQWHDGEQGELLSLCDGPLRFKCSHGHTPYLMHPYNDQYIYLADLIPTAHHIPIPWVMGYDIAPGQTTKDKLQMLQFVCEHKLKVIYEHDPEFWGSSVIKDAKGKFVVETNYKTQANDLVVALN